MREKKHFSFGKNWEHYSHRIEPSHVNFATRDLVNLIKLENLEGLTVLDVGSGSGIHSLSIMRLGCKDLVALDYDVDSVRTTKSVLESYSFQSGFEAFQGDILKIIPEIEGRFFDLVYSWGVLHHTGNMMRGIERSSSYVKPGGLIALALYRKTPFCFFWKIEKAIYSKSPRFLQILVQKSYEFIFLLGIRLKNRESFKDYKNRYFQKRGMEFTHDVHDWLGGYPYESIHPADLVNYMEELGFTLINSHITKQRIGLLGSGCDEFLFRRD